jgi:hypothetical protein
LYPNAVKPTIKEDVEDYATEPVAGKTVTVVGVLRVKN